MRTWAAIALAELAALASPALADPVEPPAMTAAPARLDWTLTRAADGASLQIAYTVTSTADRTIYLCDALPVPGQQSFVLGRTFINVAGGAPGEVRLVRGRLASIAPVILPLEPGARPLAPGATLQGTAIVPLPLIAAHYHGKAQPLSGAPAQVWLELGWVEADAHWRNLTLETGQVLTTPGPEDEMGWLRAGPLPVP